MAMQFAKAKDQFYFFGAFYAVAVPACIVRKFVAPILPLTFALGLLNGNYLQICMFAINDFFIFLALADKNDHIVEKIHFAICNTF